MVKRHRIAAARAAAAVLAAAGVAAGCDRSMDQGATRNATALNDANDSMDVVPPVTEKPLDREVLLILAMRAASREALGTQDGDAQRLLDGKAFEVRIRFGCAGPVEDKRHNLAWRLGGDKRTLRLRAAPSMAADDPLVQAVGGEHGFEEVEGFWMPRPWLLAAACPVQGKSFAAAAAKEPAASTDKPGNVAEPAAGRIGIAQFFTPADSRTHRRSARAYEAVVNLETGRKVGRAGFDLVLSGRLKALADGRVIACASSDPDRRPDCIIAATIDTVRMEQPEDGAVLARWDSN